MAKNSFITIKCKGNCLKSAKKRIESGYFGQAAHHRLFIGANPLLSDMGTFACCVSTLDRFIPP